jgi:hypothetical protein
MAKQKSKKTGEEKTNLILIGIIIAVLAFGGGYLFATTLDSDNTETQNDSSSMESDVMEHSHSSTFEVSEEEAPSVAVEVTQDAKSGWNVHIITSDFVFTPEAASTPTNVIGEGHAHLYVDGVKIARVYGDWFHYPENFEGEKEFRVTLNANDHSDYAVNGEVIESSVYVHPHDANDPDHMH